jgi:hypothetical protein
VAARFGDSSGVRRVRIGRLLCLQRVVGFVWLFFIRLFRWLRGERFPCGVWCQVVRVHFGFWRNFGLGRCFGSALWRRGEISAITPHFHKAAVGAQVLAVAERVITDEQVKGTGIAERAEGQGCSGRVVFAASDGTGLIADLMVHGGLFHAPEAELTPAGDGHLFDEGAFDRAFRLKLLFQIGEDLEEALFEFAFQDDGFGEQAVFDGVAGGVVFALGRDGSAGPGSVSTGGLDLTFGAHCDFVIAWRTADPAKLGSILLISREI